MKKRVVRIRMLPCLDAVTPDGISAGTAYQHRRGSSVRTWLELYLGARCAHKEMRVRLGKQANVRIATELQDQPVVLHDHVRLRIAEGICTLVPSEGGV
jgi:hypothetical protein